jgi:hypothetical protein
MAVRSRHRLVCPTLEETTARAIEACEAVWAFSAAPSGSLSDNIKAITVDADPLVRRPASRRA